MAELAHAPADYGEQETLPLEFVTPEAGTVDMSAVPADVTENITHSPAYLRLVELRDGAYARRRSGARTIAREAFAALQAGDVSKEEYTSLFTADETGHIPAQSMGGFDDYSTERPAREPDWAERAAGEAVRHPWDTEDD
jgi:hypothetical protein